MFKLDLFLFCYYRPQAKLWEGNVFTSVYQSGNPPSHNAAGRSPPKPIPPPQKVNPLPFIRRQIRQIVNWAVCILLGWSKTKIVKFVDRAKI